MDKKRIYKRLQNGKGIEAFYRKSDEILYTIRLKPNGDKTELHTFYFDGNDVMDDANYKDEKIRNFDDLDTLFSILEREFPNVVINL